MSTQEDSMPEEGFNNNIIKLNGISGVFQTIGSNVRVRYLATKANSNLDEKILSELKPMRETANPKDIPDIESILQRDLDDMRISQQILPYLLNERFGRSSENHLPFFPSILAVLIPKGLIKDDDIFYPKYDENDENKCTRKGYNNYWSIYEYYNKQKDGSIAYNNFAKLELDISKVDILVLDGQHRANAFRALTGKFPPQHSVYTTFYNQWQGKLPASEFNSDLPMTLIWFESPLNSHELNAKELIRDLFISVNQNSKPVSLSRQILLDDSTPNTLLTRIFYTYLLLNHKFELGKLSLFHFGLDYDEELRDRKTISSFNLFVPEAVSFAFDFFYFSSIRYYLGDKRKNKTGDFNVSLENFSEYFQTNGPDYFEIVEDNYGDKQKIVKHDMDKRVFSSQLVSTVEFIRIHEIINGFPLISFYLTKLDELKNSYDNHLSPFDDPAAQTAFEEIIRGEQGLYFAMRRTTSTTRPNKFWHHVQKIETTLLDSLNETFKIQNQGRAKDLIGADFVSLKDAFEKIQTKVFLTSLLFACESYNKEKGIPFKSSAEFIARLGNITLEKWTKGFVIFWKIWIGGELTPMAWPSVTTLILRLCQDNSKNELFYKNPINSPEYDITKNRIESAIENYRNEIHKGINWEHLKIDDFQIRRLNMIFHDEFILVSDLMISCEMEITPFDYHEIGWNRVYNKLKMNDQDKAQHILLRNSNI